MTKRQELETSLLATFLCNYSNFVLNSVHKTLDIWSAVKSSAWNSGTGWTQAA